MNEAPEWELVTEEYTVGIDYVQEETSRLQLPGGFLYRTVVKLYIDIDNPSKDNADVSISTSMVYVPCR